MTDFGPELTQATKINKTLGLASGTFVLGDRRKGFQALHPSVFQRNVDALILSGASNGEVQDVVVKGTPGIQTPMFGFYLLCLLHCEGKTVVLI